MEQAIRKLRTFYEKKRRMPSYSELASLFQYASKQAAYRLADKLIDAGVLKRDESGKLIPQMGGVGSGFASPLRISGYVQAGFPSPAEEELVDTMTLDQYLVRRPESSFLLKVTGDSMSGAGILPGDIVVVERGREPKGGDVVLAEIDREWTLKYYRPEGRRVALVAANPKYPTLYPQEELQIAGVVAAVVRRYR